MLLKDFYEMKWLPKARLRLRECTLSGYASAWKLHVLPRFGICEVSQIGVSEVNAWLESFVSVGAARKAWSFLRNLLRCAARDGYQVQDLSGVVSPRLPHYEPDTLTATQIRVLLRGFYGYPLETWLICSVCCGLRREESCGLMWSDIDLRAGIIHIRRGMQWIDGHEVITDPKTELSRRDVALPRFAVRRLRELKPRKDDRIIGSLSAPQVARIYKRTCIQQRLPLTYPLGTFATHGRPLLSKLEWISAL